MRDELHWNDAKLQDVTCWSGEDIYSLRRIYKTFSSHTINDNSLIVLSDRNCNELPEYVETIQGVQLHPFNDIPCHPWRCCCFRSSGLYTGDTVMKRSVRRSKYSDRYESFVKELALHTRFVSLMQIPHHGSGNNSNVATLCDSISHRLFCNYASSDTGNGTFILTANNLDTVWKNVYMVTENVKTLFEEHYTFII